MPYVPAPRTILIVVLLFVLLLLAFIVPRCSPRTPAANELRLELALRDSLRVGRDENGTLRYEKLALQGTLAQLRAHVGQLNDQQRRLSETVARYEKQRRVTGKTLIAAGSVRYQTGLHAALPPVFADSSVTAATATGDSTRSLHFAYASDSISYRAEVAGLARGQRPSLALTQLALPNEATVSFTWDEKKPGVPVSFSVRNSNPLYRVSGVESYAIPDLRPGLVEPTGLAKVVRDVKRAAPFLGIGTLVGLTVGAALSR